MTKRNRSAKSNRDKWFSPRLNPKRHRALDSETRAWERGLKAWKKKNGEPA